MTGPDLLLNLAEGCGGYVKQGQNVEHLRGLEAVRDLAQEGSFTLHHQDGQLLQEGTILKDHSDQIVGFVYEVGVRLFLRRSRPQHCTVPRWAFLSH
jgi:hypothetical protein